MQALSLLHVSEYGFGQHDHNGKTCNVFLSGDHNKLLKAESDELVTPYSFTFKVILPEEIIVLSGKKRLFNSRAPPYFS